MKILKKLIAWITPRKRKPSIEKFTCAMCNITVNNAGLPDGWWVILGTAYCHICARHCTRYLQDIRGDQKQ